MSQKLKYTSLLSICLLVVPGTDVLMIKFFLSNHVGNVKIEQLQVECL